MCSVFLAILMSVCTLSANTNNHIVRIPGGSLKPFWLQAKSEDGKLKKSQPVKISPFQSMKYQVTNREFIEFLNANPSWQKSKISKLFTDESYLNHFKNDLEIKTGFDLEAPVIYVSWFAASAYCKSKKLRLPSTNEWEFMALANEKSRDAGDDPKYYKRILDWYSAPMNDVQTPKVGSIYKNIYGVYDLHGLVWEWVEDLIPI